jgi:hypothetical protein
MHKLGGIDEGLGTGSDSKHPSLYTLLTGISFPFCRNALSRVKAITL